MDLFRTRLYQCYECYGSKIYNRVKHEISKVDVTFDGVRRFTCKIYNNKIMESYYQTHEFWYKLCLIVLFMFVSMAMLVFSAYLQPPSKEPILVSDHEKINSRKLVLIWSNLFESWKWLSDAEVTRICPELKNSFCQVTTNKKKYLNANAILFHWPRVDYNYLPNPIKKPLGQKWVIINYESPANTPKIPSTLSSFIEWTVSYRQNSDIFSPYGRLRLRKPDDIHWNLTIQEFENKKPVAWMVSNCNTTSGRENFTKRLKKYIPVDMFGRCGKATHLCGKTMDRTHCYRNLAKNYKFYLSFENSLCTDYATEKFFLPLEVGMVPVTLGGADYAKFAPKGSFINAFDFKSPETLATYLKKVAGDFELYKSYFNWKKDYVVDFSDLEDTKSRFWVCDLCQRLHQNVLNSTETGTKKNLYNWWFKEGNCTSWKN